MSELHIFWGFLAGFWVGGVGALLMVRKRLGYAKCPDCGSPTRSPSRPLAARMDNEKSVPPLPGA